MLRSLVLALVLANAGYYAWSDGLLAAYGLAPARQAEPERLALQIRPEAMRLFAEAPAPVKNAMPPAAPAPVQLPPAALPTTAQNLCLKTGPFNEKQVTALERRLHAAGLRSGSWLFDIPPGAARWVVYLGRYVSPEALGRRRARLEQLGVAFETPASPLLRPGLVLATFGSKAEAENALTQMTEPGLRSARVVIERPELATRWLKFPAADAPLQARLEGFKPALGEAPLRPCE